MDEKYFKQNLLPVWPCLYRGLFVWMNMDACFVSNMILVSFSNMFPVLLPNVDPSIFSV